MHHKRTPILFTSISSWSKKFTHIHVNTQNETKMHVCNHFHASFAIDNKCDLIFITNDSDHHIKYKILYCFNRLDFATFKCPCYINRFCLIFNHCKQIQSPVCLLLTFPSVYCANLMWYLIVCVFCVSSFHLIIIKYSRIYIIVFENKYFVLIPKIRKKNVLSDFYIYITKINLCITKEHQFYLLQFPIHLICDCWNETKQFYIGSGKWILLEKTFDF
jgi:hypothetical protein